MRELRAREEEKRQQEFLESAWEEWRLLDPEGSSDEEWDPIEDAVEDERGIYINLLRHFLWMEAVSQNASKDANGKDEILQETSNTTVEGSSHPEMADSKDSDRAEDAPKSKNAKKRVKQKAKASEAQKDQPKPGEVHVETRGEMRERLRMGQKLNFPSGWGIVGTVDTPYGIHDKTSPLRNDEIDRLLAQIPEIKQLLLCRLLLAHATLLPAALRANSIEDFLADEEVTNVDLRDLTLKIEQPGRQELRDACADLHRPENEESTEDDSTEEKMENIQVSTTRLPLPRSVIKNRAS
ncbi:MAG: hypothetical protein MMC23_003974 [Stictis urceolatum]|nr:hypothetical protein [Stictis urceolata]